MSEAQSNLAEKLKESEETIKKLSENLSLKENEIKEHVNLIQRIQADFQNYMKQAEKERRKAIESSCDNLLLQIADICENLEKAVNSIPPASDNKKTIKGLTAVLRQAQKIAEDNGVKKIKTTGAHFDASKHEVVETIESHEKPENTIAEEIQSGYTIKDRLIRPAKVIVTKKKEVGENA